MRIEAALARIPTRLAFWALAAVALFLSHDTIFLAQVGPGESLTRVLREAGHDYWGLASLALALLAMASAFAVLVRLRRLRRRAASLGAAAATGERIRLLPTWLRLFTLVAIGFVVQENVEHYLSHQHASGLGILLGPEYPVALPVIAVISGLAALLATATGAVERQLLAGIAAALGRAFGRAPRNLPRLPLRPSVPRMAPLARSAAGRAPPPTFALQP
ncbi:MAG: hypothetical protein M3406_15290 [Chloroflexota bacterium]|nr:hypothetical protein [Chloroflexota bacterium]